MLQQTRKKKSSSSSTPFGGDGGATATFGVSSCAIADTLCVDTLCDETDDTLCKDACALGTSTNSDWKKGSTLDSFRSNSSHASRSAGSSDFIASFYTSLRLHCPTRSIGRTSATNTSSVSCVSVAIVTPPTTTRSNADTAIARNSSLRSAGNSNRSATATTHSRGIRVYVGGHHHSHIHRKQCYTYRLHPRPLLMQRARRKTRHGLQQSS